MNKNSNKYIITYASVMVIVVAAVLSFAAMKLKTAQDNNVKMEKMGDILRSINKGQDADKVANKFAYIEEQYKKYIVNSLAVDSAGNIVEGAEPFTLLLNLKAEYDKPLSQRSLPLFESKDDNGELHYIIPVSGSGLWGPLWGYIALNDDWKTIYGVIFAHKGETPGLGAEIATPPFENQFKGKTIFTDGKLNGIMVLKGAGSSKGNPSAVDAISGGTITSRGVQNMVNDCLKGYAAYIEKVTAVAQDTTTVAEPSAAADSLIKNSVNYEQKR